MEPQSQTTPASLIALMGGIEMEVCSITGTREGVRVRQLPIRLLPELLKRYDDEPGMVELYCDKPTGWSETIKVEDFERLLAKGEEINELPFRNWVQRRQKRQERLFPGITAKLEAAILPFQSSLPESRSSAS